MVVAYVAAYDFRRIPKFLEVSGTSLILIFGVQIRFSGVIYGRTPVNGSPGCWLLAVIDFFMYLHVHYCRDFTPVLIVKKPLNFLFQIEKQNKTPILYSYFRSSASWRVRIVLALKGVDYEYKAVNLVKDGGQQHSEEFKALNPMEQVPAFVIGETALTQSLAIIDYLEDVYPKPAIVPEDPIKKAQARALAELIAAGTQPIQNLGVLQKVSDKPEERAEWGRFWIDKGFAAYEKMVQSTAGKYSVGDEITIADVCLVPQLYNAQRFKVDMTKFPTITRIIDALSELPAFKAADPGVQPDCPEELRKQ